MSWNEAATRRAPRRKMQVESCRTMLSRKYMTCVSVAVLLWVRSVGATAEPMVGQSAEAVYEKAVALYASGERDPAVRTVAILPNEEIKRYDNYWFRSGGSQPSRSAVVSIEMLRAVIMLHTDCVLLLLSERGHGEEIAHLELARRIGAALLSRDPDSNWYVARWYLAVGVFYHSTGYYDIAEDILQDGLAMYPGDALLALGLGAVAESKAAVAVDHPFDVEHGLVAQRDDLRAASKYYVRALESDSGLIEARLRLAHVRQPTDPEGSVREYSHILDGDVRSQSGEFVSKIKYLASLFRGEANRRQGRLVLAENDFMTAIKMWPNTQAARTALASVYLQMNRLEDAIRVVNESMSLQAARTADPWILYQSGNLGSFEVLMLDLRR